MEDISHPSLQVTSLTRKDIHTVLYSQRSEEAELGRLQKAWTRNVGQMAVSTVYSGLGKALQKSSVSFEWEVLGPYIRGRMTQSPRFPDQAGGDFEGQAQTRILTGYNIGVMFCRLIGSDAASSLRHGMGESYETESSDPRAGREVMS